ncbi:hypothetical protein [Maribacter sp. 4G9]|uniref:hypothetical protein n=1 Tax=Maribacter sp. 4G9 TaxID=1889777 RepID=UPI000F515AD2|nr:hypothetical protein [Maribacter sp. 4G9]
MKMTFYIDNRVDQKKELTHSELISEFVANEQAYQNLLYGQPFERCFLASMPGVPEPVRISDEDWKGLWNEFKSQVPNPEYKV